MAEPTAFKVLEVEIVRGEVLVTFDDGRLFLYSAESLRTAFPNMEIVDIDQDAASPASLKGEQKKSHIWRVASHLRDR